VTLKTAVMMLKNSSLNHRNKLHFNIKREKLFKNVIFHNTFISAFFIKKNGSLRDRKKYVLQNIGKLLFVRFFII